jgi:hypothetical protein
MELLNNMKNSIIILLLSLLSLTLQAQKFDFKVKSQITHTVYRF